VDRVQQDRVLLDRRSLAALTGGTALLLSHDTFPWLVPARSADGRYATGRSVEMGPMRTESCRARWGWV